MNTRTIGRGLVLATLAILPATAGHATIVPAYSVSTQADGAGFDSLIRNNDLINVGQASLASAAQDKPTFGGTGAYGTIVGSHDGATVQTEFGTEEYIDNSTTFTYQLNLFGAGGSPSGYNLNGVQVISGWRTAPDSYSWQKWDLQIATLANPTFTTVQSVSYSPAGARATLVSLTDTTGLIATGVTGVQIVMKSFTPGDLSVLREIDVLGSAVPEPSSLMLLAVGGLLLFRRRLGRVRA